MLSPDIYFRTGVLAVAEKKGYVINVIDPYNEKYIDNLNMRDLVIFHADKTFPLLLPQILKLSGKVKLLLVEPNKLKLSVICNVNESIDEYASLEQLSSAIIRIINSKEYYQKTYTQLTIREQVVLIETLHGVKVNVTAKRLNISTKTVYSHKLKAFRKLGVRNTQDALPLKNIILERYKQTIWGTVARLQREPNLS
jgi:DNA-binding CsgD family transcriptional regulator